MRYINELDSGMCVSLKLEVKNTVIELPTKVELSTKDKLQLAGILRRGTPINLSNKAVCVVYCDKAKAKRYVWGPVDLELQQTDGRYVYIVKYDKPCISSNRRSAVRLKFTEVIRVRSNNAKPSHDFTAYVIDCSVNGIGFQSKEMLPTGMSLQITIAGVVLTGAIVRRIDLSDGYAYGVALDYAPRDYVAYLNKKELELLKHRK